MQTKPFRIKQTRVVSAGDSQNFAVAVPEEDKLAIRNIAVNFFSQQGEQDLIVMLKQGNSVLYRSGKVQVTESSDPFPRHISETRLNASSGAPYNAISSSDGVGYPDNLASNGLFNTVAKKNEPIFFKIVNQSNHFDHAIEFELDGQYLRTQ